MSSHEGFKFCNWSLHEQKKLTTKSTDDHVATLEQVLAEEKATLLRTEQHTHKNTSQLDESWVSSQRVQTSPDPTRTKNNNHPGQNDYGYKSWIRSKTVS